MNPPTRPLIKSNHVGDNKHGVTINNIFCNTVSEIINVVIINIS